ncbi:MAG: hypothetical protein LAO31_19670 [Acidobacteriia bacterium]|nr:hypothetical protein [Terriglobia bacterium]
MCISALLLLLVTMASCRGCASRKIDEGKTGQYEDALAPLFVDAPVSFCRKNPVQPKRGKVQILIDSSGSLIGFQHTIAPLANWIKNSFSGLRESMIDPVASSVCQFDQNKGISNCTDFNQPLGPYRPSGDTNLHDAFRASRDNDLTFILTDGVAATGSRGSGDCAGGVDAACVARAMKDAMHAQSLEGDDVDRGLWIFPVVAQYDGTFFTEQPISPTAFQPNETIRRIRSDSDVGAQVGIQNPHVSADGNLVFQYRGPRMILLIVIARWADLGRAAVQSLWERAEFLGIRRIDQMRAYSSGLATLLPIEVYPGFLNPVRWQKLAERDSRGTIDVVLKPVLDKSSITIQCPKSAQGEGDFSLTSSPLNEGQVAGCVPIRLLPAINLRLRPVRDEDATDLSKFVKDYGQQKGSYSDLALHLACTPELARPCNSNPIVTQWTGYMNYEAAANCLASPECHSPSLSLIKDLSTSNASIEPHRIFGLTDTVRVFFQDISDDKRSIVLGTLDVCTNQ